MNTKNTPHYYGHRERLKQRLFDMGGENIPDYELLELILFRSLPRRDVKPIAKNLIEKFGSFAETINAEVNRLVEIPGINHKTAQDLKIIMFAARRITKGKVKQRQQLHTWADIIDYCRTIMAFENHEICRIIFLDKQEKLIVDEQHGSGTIDQTPIYPRDIIKRALELNSSSIIIVHNHPSGNLDPSTADIRITKEIIRIAEPIGIKVKDHIIVSKQGHFSFKGMRLI